LEIDPRCTQIAAFNLALAAWRRVGYSPLPPMNLACSGLAPNTNKAEWLTTAGDNERLRNGMERLFRLFENAAVLGSLINPRAEDGDLLVAGFQELQPLMEQALAREGQDDSTNELAVTARGLTNAAEILADKFTLVATNVPYLGRRKQNEALKEHSERIYQEAKADLATCFLERCIKFCGSSCTAALVMPNIWLFLGTYKNLRRHLLANSRFNAVARLGPGAFETISGEVVNATLIQLTNGAQGRYMLSLQLIHLCPAQFRQRPAICRRIRCKCSVKKIRSLILIAAFRLKSEQATCRFFRNMLTPCRAVGWLT
jgi:hypothetical protein